MSTIVVLYENREVHTIPLKGRFRGIAWDPKGDFATLVGDNGKTLRIFSDQTVRELDSGTASNLRSVSANPNDGALLIVGNSGTLFYLGDSKVSIQVPTFENLRTVSWNAKGTIALVGGNAGALLKYADLSVRSIGDQKANLRRIAWQPHYDRALITSNCFAEQFLPSANLFLYDSDQDHVQEVNRSQADLIGVDWEPNGEFALVAGYDIVWHTGIIAQFNGTKLIPLEFENKQVYPVGVAFGESAAVCTAVAQSGNGTGSVSLWKDGKLSMIFESDQYYFSTVAWSKHGILMALGSPANRTFNC